MARNCEECRRSWRIGTTVDQAHPCRRQEALEDKDKEKAKRIGSTRYRTRNSFVYFVAKNAAAAETSTQEKSDQTDPMRFLYFMNSL